MILFLVSFVTAWGLGELYNHFYKLENPGARFSLGLALITLTLNLIPLWLPISLPHVAQFTGLTGFVSASYFAWKKKSDYKHALTHPLIVLSFVNYLLQRYLLPAGYLPWVIDELAHWSTMPKMILNHAKVSSLDFPLTRYLEYTPGWPLFQDFPLFVTHSPFSTSWFLYATFLISLGAAAFLYDLFKSEWKNLFSSQKNTLLSWLFLLILIGVNSGMHFFARNALIENATEPIGLIFFLQLVIYMRDREAKHILILGIFAAWAYSLKKTGAVFVPPLIMMGALAPKGKRLQYTVLSLIPFLLFFFTWKYVTRDYKPLLFANKADPSSLKLFYAVFQLSVKEALGILRSNFLNTFIIISCVIYGWRNRQNRPLYYSLLLVMILYLLGMINFYVLGIPEGELKLDKLNSFERYFYTPYRFIFTLTIAIGLCGVVPGFIKKKAVMPLVYILFIYTVYNTLQFSIKAYNNVAKQNHEMRMLNDVPKLLEEIEKRKIRGANLVALHLYDSSDWQWTRNYLAMDMGKDYAFNMNLKHHFDSHDPSFETAVSEAQIIWPIMPADWERKYFSEKGVPCAEKLENYFLFRDTNKPELWTCISKVK